MPQVAKPVIKARAAALRALGGEHASAFLAGQVGQVLQPIMETETRGRTAQFAEIDVAEPQSIGAMPLVRVTGVKDGRLHGAVARSAAA
jgi:threonylcarbamoyladenosine tRNA methylthiotransferase MtaB